MTTLAPTRAPTVAVVQLGHSRWAIENTGFNELVTRGHADHVYRHEPIALLVCTLLAILCLNVFLMFYGRDLKPAVRQAATRLHEARQVAAELYATRAVAAPRVPHPQCHLLCGQPGLIPEAPPGVAAPRTPATRKPACELARRPVQP